MVLHAPSLHFHIGAWFVTAVCTFLAFWINFIQRREFFQNLPGIGPVLNFDRWLGKNIVNNLDFVAHVCGIVGFFGILGSAYLGLIDASGIENPYLLDFAIAFRGLDKAMANELLGYKVVWTIVGIQLFFLAGIIRFYFVTIHKTQIYDTHIAVQTIYSGAAMWGFVIMVAISAAGGIISYQESIMQDIPILNNLLPGSEFNLLPILSIFFGFLAIMMIGTAFFARRNTEEGEITQT
ncbi:MAG: hypothetical protein ACXAC8_07085 [Candidatus Hodarchaeales archaeon]|jgi:hypothetical protein